MKIIPLAFDSFSTRSMATFVETKGCNITIDPGISIAPSRYSLPPHPIELIKLNEDWKKIKKYVKKSEILILTHYHYDHHVPDEPEIWEGKVALIKHPTEKINLSQKQRAAYFIPLIKDKVKDLQYCDGKEFKFGGTKIVFSKPVFHGPAERLGYVTEVLIEEGKERFVFTSDVEGPPLKDQTDFIIESNPDSIILDGPLSYMMYRYGASSMENSIKNMKKIINETKVKNFMIDHHFLRDINWKEKVKNIFDEAKEKGILFGSVASFMKEKEELLEARRKELYSLYDPKKYKVKEVKIKFEE
ncbi:MAG: hypothetical protein QXI58_03095 [Candidatus Micrarchaeia archaeon]